MGNTGGSNQHAENLALADLLRFISRMVLAAALAVLLLGGFVFDRDKKDRDARNEAVATVIEMYVHGGAYYVTYEADGATREALLPYKDKTLAPGDQIPILYDPTWYGDIRLDTPASEPLLLLSIGFLCAVLAVLGLGGASYLHGKDENPWSGV